MWTELVDSSNYEFFDSFGFDCERFIREKLQKFPDLASSLANITDFWNRTAISVASQGIKEMFYEYLYFLKRYEFASGPPLYKSATALVILATDHGVQQSVYERKFDNFKNNDIMTKETFDECFEEWNLSEDSIVRPSHKFDYAHCVNNNKHGEVRTKEFVQYCVKVLGAARKVVLKFMTNEDQFKQEKVTREENKFNSKFVMNIIEHSFNFEKSKHKFLKDDDYKYLIVMPAADRSLEDIIKKEKPDSHAKMQLLKDIAEAIDHLHSKGVMHGDIKALNIVRTDKSLKLIDLDASAYFYDETEIDETEKDETEKAGAKFSSSVLPPEMFAELNKCDTAKFVKYFEDIKESDQKLWKKIEPFGINRQQYSCVVRCFNAKKEKKLFHNRDNGITNTLGEDFLIKATPAIDIWSFGILMFYTLSTTSEYLFAADINDDLSRKDGQYHKLMKITDEDIRTKIFDNITDEYAQSLLIKILKTKQSERLQLTFKEILVSFINMFFPYLFNN